MHLTILRARAAFMLAAIVCALAPRTAASHGTASPVPAPSPVPVVVALHEITASRAAAIIRGFYPNLRVRVDTHANAVIAVAPPDEADAIRTILQGIAASVDAEVLHVVSPAVVLPRLESVFRTARFFVAPNHTLITVASPDDMAQIKTVIAAIDTPLQTPTPKPRYAPDAVSVTQGDVHRIAREVAHEVGDVVVAIAGSDIVVRGPPDDVDRAKALIAQLDVPEAGSAYAHVYRLKYVDAASVADLLSRSFPGLTLDVNHDLNAVIVDATATLQTRISQAIAALDIEPGGSGGANAGPGVLSIQVVTLRAALPASSGGPSTTANDIAQTVEDVLRQSAPDLKITVPQNGTQLILSGSPYAIQLAKGLIAQLDVMPPLVVLDTQILEVDEGVAKQIGFEFPSAVLSTTYSEITPPAQSNGNITPLLGLQALTRTPLSLAAELNFLVSTNHARILEDPRITTVSGRTASIRAGETVNILTTTGGGTGTVATTQVQSFQTGVTLDITPIVNANGFITIELHPTVNSEAGVSAAGVPNIQTRDTTTTVGLRDGQTIVIGGLIEDDDTRTIQKIPFLGDLPLIGRLFQDANVSHTRNELIVTVTPHVVPDGETPDAVPTPTGIPTSTGIPTAVDDPTPEPLPTVDPTETLPPAIPSERGLAHMQLTPAPYATSAAGANLVIPSAASTASGVEGPPEATPSPIALPSAFSQTNVYTYGNPPTNNYAANTSPPQIFYVQVQPTVVGSGQQMTISAITTTNVVHLSFGINPVTPETELTAISPGKWQSTFSFSTAGLPIAQSNVQLTLTASTGMGGTVSVPIPISVLHP
jgi:general secretion pathway protein D